MSKIQDNRTILCFLRLEKVPNIGLNFGTNSPSGMITSLSE